MQAADVLVMNKTSLLDESTRAEVCPDLNPGQLHRLLTLYAPDEYDPDAVHPGVLKQMAALAQSNTARPMHKRIQLRRLDARLGRRRFDMSSAAGKFNLFFLFFFLSFFYFCFLFFLFWIGFVFFFLCNGKFCFLI